MRALTLLADFFVRERDKGGRLGSLVLKEFAREKGEQETGGIFCDALHLLAATQRTVRPRGA